MLMRSRVAMRSDGGSVIVMVAAFLPLVVLLASFVLDIGNWWVHKRHLQTQADAAALAAATKFRFPVCDDTPIQNEALKYSGKGFSGTVYNPQLGGTPQNEVHMELNSPSYYNRPTQVIDSDLTGSPLPCTAKMVDVKMTETNLPWFFKLAGVKYIDTHARVSLNQVGSLSGLRPIGVEDVNPKRAQVRFVDEGNNDALLGQQTLTRRPGADANGLIRWDNADTPVSFNVTSSRIGVQIVLSGSNSLTCGDPLVVCYGTGVGNGLDFVRGYKTTPLVTGDLPRAGAVALLPNTCSDGYFSVPAAACSVGISADVAFAPPIDPSSNNVVVQASIVGTKQAQTLTYDSASGRFKGTLPVNAGQGPLDVSLSWEQKSGTAGGNTCDNTNKNPCKGTFSNVHRTFTGTRANAGPIQLLQVEENSVTGINNVVRCDPGDTTCGHNFVVRLGLSGRLDVAKATDPPISLRAFGSGSQNQSLDCDKAVQHLSDEIYAGCAPRYTENTGTPCPGTATALWATTQPWSCVAIQTGTAANEPSAGLNHRVYGAEKPGNVCPPSGANHWSAYPDGDNRKIDVFLVPFGSFDGSGGGTVPVTGFASFYVTGWTGQGLFSNPCHDAGDQFVPGTENDQGSISGHFVTTIESNVDDPSETPCDFDALTPCVAVLTK